jgi:hypothetical protein
MGSATPSHPLVNRGAEALEALLAGDDEHATEQLRLLTRSELLDLAAACGLLGSLACAVVKETWLSRQGGEGRG